MKNLIILLLIGCISSIFIDSCTANQRAKNFGGTTKMKLPKGEKLINVTWKEDDIWYLTRPMISTDTAIVYEFKEKSSFGVLEGTYYIYESK